MLAIKRKKKIIKTEAKPKTPRQTERHIKGVANHRRIEILFLIAEHGGISVELISRGVGCNIKTISAHILRLEHAGLIRKKNIGRRVVHELSPYGKLIHKFLMTFQHS